MSVGLYIDVLHQKDDAIHVLCEEKLSAALEMLDILAKDDTSVNCVSVFFFFYMGTVGVPDDVFRRRNGP